jgi:RimJ/RimL family protein N-acetyltransferase
MDYDRPVSIADVAESETRAVADGYPFVIEVDGRPIGRIGLNRVRPRLLAPRLHRDPGAWSRGFGRDAAPMSITRDRVEGASSRR